MGYICMQCLVQACTCSALSTCDALFRHACAAHCLVQACDALSRHASAVLSLLRQALQTYLALFMHPLLRALPCSGMHMFCSCILSCTRCRRSSTYAAAASLQLSNTRRRCTLRQFIEHRMISNSDVLRLWHASSARALLMTKRHRVADSCCADLMHKPLRRGIPLHGNVDDLLDTHHPS